MGSNRRDITRRGRPGRPPKIDSVVGYKPGIGGQPDKAQPITAFERIVGDLRAGSYMETAARRCGLHPDSVRDWVSISAKAITEAHSAHEAEREPPQLTSHQRRCVEFSLAVEQALAESETEEVAIAARLARGGLKRTIVTEKTDAAGNVLERTTRTEEAAPDATVLMWRLRRRWPKRWGDLPTQITGADGAPIEVMLSIDEKKKAAAARLADIADALEAAKEPLPDRAPEIEDDSDG